MKVTPSIQENGLVGLKVDQRMSEQTGTFDGIPVVDNREIQTSFTVREGETIL
jgi:type II secretory pathway component GspD/PulD (secretin)